MPGYCEKVCSENPRFASSFSDMALVTCFSLSLSLSRELTFADGDDLTVKADGEPSWQIVTGNQGERHSFSCACSSILSSLTCRF